MCNFRIVTADDVRRQEISGRLVRLLGAHHQSAKVVEECSELMAVLTQYLQGRRHWVNVADELADVLTVAVHVPHIVAERGDVCVERFARHVEKKLKDNWENLSERIEEADND